MDGIPIVYDETGRVDYVETYLAPWRSERNRIHRLAKSIPRLRTRLEKHLAIAQCGLTTLSL